MFYRWRVCRDGKLLLILALRRREWIGKWCGGGLSANSGLFRGLVTA
jgi:hypothetical protein